MAKKKRPAAAPVAEGHASGPAAFPDPAERIREGAEGTPVVLADGKEWLLGDGGLDNVLDDVRDRVFRQTAIKSTAQSDDIQYAAWLLLQANYELAMDEGRALVLGADVDALARGVSEAMYGRDPSDRGYTEWALASLAANGLDHEQIRGYLRGSVLEILVETGRTIPVERFCGSIEKARSLGALRNRARKAPR